MNCKETEKMISLFLQDELEGKNLEQFVEHIEQCPECKEELSIQFLVSEGMERLEEGNNFNLQNALADRLENAKSHIRVHRGLQHTLICLETAVAVAILIAILIIFRL